MLITRHLKVDVYGWVGWLGGGERDKNLSKKTGANFTSLLDPCEAHGLAFFALIIKYLRMPMPSRNYWAKHFGKNSFFFHCDAIGARDLNCTCNYPNLSSTREHLRALLTFLVGLENDL